MKDKIQEQEQPADQLVIFALKLYQEKGYDVLYSSVVVNAIYWLYEKLVQLNQVPPVEVISTEQKNFFWNIAKKYYTGESQAVKAAKCAYIINIINNN